MWVAFIVSALVLTAFSACGTMPPSEHLPQASDKRSSRVEPMVAQSAVLQSLQRQVRERDRRIAELYVSTGSIEGNRPGSRSSKAARSLSGYS